MRDFFVPFFPGRPEEKCAPNAEKWGKMSTLTTSLKAWYKAEPLLPSLRKLRNPRYENKISAIFAHIFSTQRVRKFLGANIAFVVLASTIVPTQSLDASNFTTEVIQAQNPITTEHGVKFPLTSIKINQGYHLFHPGVDFEGVTGDPIYAIMAGSVRSVEHSRFAYGNSIIIDHGNGLSSLYAHLSSIEVKVGQVVTTDSKLGEVGSTGRSTGDHLHLEIRENERAVNPFSILPRVTKQSLILAQR